MAEHLDRLTERLAEQIAARTASFQTNHPGGSSFLPTNMAGTPFKATNALTLAAEGQAQGYTDTRWITRPQAERMGGRVQQGEQATPVQYWEIQGSQRKLTVAAVFNAEQVSGLPAQDRKATIMQARTAAVDAIVAGSHANIQHTNGPPGFDRTADVIRLTERAVGDNPARQQQEAIVQLTAWTNHPSRIERAYDPNDVQAAAREQLRNSVAAMLVSDRLKIGFQGNDDPMLARALTEFVRDRAEIARAGMMGEIVAKEVLSFGMVRTPELSQAQMQHAAVKTLNPEQRAAFDKQITAREKAWATASSSQVNHSPQRSQHVAARQTLGI